MVYLMNIHRLRQDKLFESRAIFQAAIRVAVSHGARVIGPWSNWIGGDTSEIIYLFEFENFADYEAKDVKIHQDPAWREAITKVNECSLTRQTRLLRPFDV